MEDVLGKGLAGVPVKLRGWVYRLRRIKDKVFIVLRDSTGIIQVVADKGVIEDYRGLGIEASILVEGTIRRDERAPGGFEIAASKVTVVGPSKEFPISRDFSREFLLDVRHLWVRSTKMTAMMKLRSEVFRFIREFFHSRGFYEVQAPMFITAAVEGGATLFEVPYFDRGKVYLTQSSQFYLEALIFSLEKVYTVAPSFRAEKSRTRRHLTEFWHVEAEEAWIHLDELLRLEEELVSYVVKSVLENCSRELKVLGRNTKPLEEVSPPFPRISYDEAIEMLRSKGFQVSWGDDLGADEERALTKEFSKPVFIVGFPTKCKAFYHRSNPRRPEVTLAADLLAPEGYGEIIGGGERIFSEKELIEKIRDFGLRPEDYEWYIDLRRYGSVPHSGFGLGADRLVMWIGGLDHIMDAIPFPRTIRRTYP